MLDIPQFYNSCPLSAKPPGSCFFLFFRPPPPEVLQDRCFRNLTGAVALYRADTGHSIVAGLRSSAHADVSETRMVLLQHIAQVFPVQMGIDLGGGDAFVPEHFLHGHQVRAAFHEVRGERMPEGMR